MEEIFIEKYNVNPSLVADVHQYIYKSSGVVGVHPDEVIERTKLSIQGEQLYRCLMCDALIEYILDKDMFERGGSLHNLALKIHKKLDTNKLYSFPIQGAVCSYDEDKDCLIPDKKRSKPKACAFCSGGMLRKVAADGSVEYINGDRTSTPCVGSKCPCGFKHFWNGKEYDNLPELIPVSLHWGGKTVTEEIAWFQSETDNTLDSNVFEVAQNLVQKHFPGEFGSERMVQQVVDSILAQSAASLKEGGATQRQDSEKPMDTFNPETASKIILTGFKKKTMHKEELVKSEKEKQVLSNIQTHAPKMQQKKTTKDTAATKAHSELASVESSGDQFMGEKMDQSLSAGSDSVQGEKKVRVQTSDGRQVMLTLVKDVTYSELRKLMYDAVGVQADCQKIRIGFPPKLLEGNEDTLLDIKHGDKITLEVLLDKAPDVKICEEASGHSEASWRGFEEDAHSQTAEKLLQALRDVDHGGDSIDTSIASLGILSAVSGKDMWTNVQSMPHLFSVGGLLYQQVKRDLGLIDGKHCQLPCLPGKVFRYNATDDRLELCLEPHGHFQVEPRIEAQVMEGLRTDARSQAKFGASGAVHQPSDRAAFSGQGHTLKSSMGADARMPGDLEYTPRAPHARGFHDLCSLPGSNTESICEEPEQEEHAAHEMKTESAKLPVGYQRLAPGYSVIDPDRTKEDNSNIEMFRSLAEHIEKTLAENMEEDNEDDNKKMEPNLAVIETEADKMEADIGGKMVDMGVIQVGEDPTCVVVDERLYICSKFAKSGTDLGDEVDAESEAKEDTCKKVAIDDTLVDNAVRYGSWDTMETQAEKQVETVDKEKKASDMFTETDE